MNRPNKRAPTRRYGVISWRSAGYLWCTGVFVLRFRCHGTCYKNTSHMASPPAARPALPRGRAHWPDNAAAGAGQFRCRRDDSRIGGPGQGDALVADRYGQAHRAVGTDRCVPLGRGGQR